MRIFSVTCRSYDRPVLAPMGKRARALSAVKKNGFHRQGVKPSVFLPVRPMTRSPPYRERAYAPSLRSEERVSTSFGP